MSWSLSHERHASAVSSIRARTPAGSVGAGRCMSAAAHRMANPACSSAATVKVAVMVESETSTGTPALIAIWFGPPNVRPPSGVARRSGRTSPYSGRGASSRRISTEPSMPSTRRRISCGASRPTAWWRCPSANAIASVTRTLPPSVVNTVSRTSVPGRYRRSLRNGAVGASVQCPASASRIRENTAGLSYRGRHSQSIAPSMPTRAAELQSERMPYPAIGRAPDGERSRALAGAAVGVAESVMSKLLLDRATYRIQSVCSLRVLHELEEIEVACARDGIGARVCSELAIDALRVRLRRVQRDVHLSSDRPHRQVRRQEAEQCQLPLGELVAQVIASGSAWAGEAPLGPRQHLRQDPRIGASRDRLPCC